MLCFALQRRIKRMEEAGVIRAHVALLEPALVGQPITIVVEVEVISETADLLAAAKRVFYYVTGEADFVLVVTAKSMSAYEALTRRLLQAAGARRSGVHQNRTTRNLSCLELLHCEVRVVFREARDRQWRQLAGLRQRHDGA
jgi:DNA-binding Lrp family transcriptional regulator